MRPTSVVQWTRYPALWAVSAFAMGIFLAASAPPWMARAASLGGLTGAAVLLVLASVWDQRRLVSLAPLLRTATLVLVLASAGALRYTMGTEPAANSVAHLARDRAAADRPYRLHGTVDDIPSNADGTTRFTLDLDSLEHATGAVNVQGKIRVTLRTPLWEDAPTSFPRLRAGDRVAVRGTVRRPPMPRNPGSFDYGAYLARRGVCCTMWVSDPDDVRVTGDTRSFVGDGLVHARSHVRASLRAHVPTADARAVLQALLLGDRSAIDPETEEHFVATGLMHLLAVSGLHVLLVGMVLYGLLRPLLMRLRMRWQTVEVLRAALTIAVLGFYMLLTGARPSVVRAVVMATLLIGGIVLQRSGHALNTLGVAALILLAIRPPALFDAGFQLSMGAVGAIVTLNPRLTAWLPESWDESSAALKLASMVTVSVAATAGTLPVLLHHFGRASMAGLLLNVPAIPFTALALTAGLLTVLFGGLAGGLAATFGAAADVLIHALLQTARWGTEWLGWSEIWAATPGPWMLGALTAAVVAVAQWPRPRTRWRCMAAVLFFLAVDAWMPILRDGPSPHLDVVFLDVGQGDASLISTPSGRHVLIDTGPRTRYSDAGKRIIGPYLQSRGIRHLDAVVVTHPDGDHIGGLASILDAVSVGTVYHNGWKATSETYVRALQQMEAQSIVHRPLDAGDELLIDPSVRMSVLAPPSMEREHGIDNENEASVVLRVVYGTTRWLFTGDIEYAGEQYLTRVHGRSLRSNVVKVAHHGSSTSSTRPFVRAVTADSMSTYAVISVGQDNAFGMPSASVVDRWQEQGASVQTTQMGAVWLRSNGQHVRRVEWRDKKEPGR